MSRLNLTLDELNREYANYRKQSDTRFGQHLWNKYGVVGGSFPELYYAPNHVKAYDIALVEMNGDLFGGN